MLETTRNGYLTNVTGWVAESRADPNIPARTLDKRLPGKYLSTHNYKRHRSVHERSTKHR